MYQKWYILGHVFKDTKIKVLGLFEKVLEDGKYTLNMQSGIYLPVWYWKKFVTKIDEILLMSGMNDLEVENMLGNRGEGQLRRQLYRGEGDKGNFKLYFWTIQDEAGNVLKKDDIGQVSEKYSQARFDILEKNDLNFGEKCVIVAEKRVPPSAVDLMKIVFCHKVITDCNATAADECEGCQHNAAAQKHHGNDDTVIGCATSEIVKVDYFFEKVVNKIRPQELMSKFDTLRGKCGLNPIPCYQLSRAALDYLSKGDILRILSKAELFTDKLAPINRLIVDI